MSTTDILVAPPKPSYEVNTLNLKPGPIHARLLAYYNEMHEAIAASDTETIEDLEQLVPALLDEFELTECQTTANPAWVRSKMRAGWEVARGDFRSALQFEIEGFRAANAESDSGDDIAKDRRKSISASNIADELWRLNHAQEGLPWAQLSVQLWPANSINHLVLALTAYHAGLHKEADEILAELRQVANFEDKRDVLANCMLFERELNNLTALPSVQSLLHDMEVVK